jgi:hypothetical protein
MSFNGASLSKNKLMFSEMSNTMMTVISKVMAKKNDPKYFLRM